MSQRIECTVMCCGGHIVVPDDSELTLDDLGKRFRCEKCNAMYALRAEGRFSAPEFFLEYLG